ncbi:MAG TPA: phospholipase D-like domain-containing protein [Jatrophihabitans sp.]|nr:phospholipase D-like domain-containing protein [Jatrophihabitans sp.]
MHPESYLPAASAECPTFVDDSEWLPLVDGERYFAELDVALKDLGRGDSVLIAGLELDTDLDLCGRRAGDPGYQPLGDRLLRAAATGARVRVLLAGKVSAQRVPVPALKGFRDNVTTAHRLQSLRPDGWPADAAPPLQGRVLVDWSGRMLGSHHQKVAVVDRGGELTAFVGGIDLVANRWDAVPHDRLRLRGRRWGWHDAAVRLRGPAATQVHRALTQRWREASTLPSRRYLDRSGHLVPMNPHPAAPALPPPAEQLPAGRPGTAVRVLRSMGPRKIDSPFPWRRAAWDHLPAGGYQEIHETLTCALRAARSYVYIEDQYLGEETGGDRRFELYTDLRDAAARGVKVILVGSGTRDPDDPGFRPVPINRVVNADLRHKILDRLDEPARARVVVYRIWRATVHSKLVLIDDRFACIGSANMFSRSMAGVDCELATAVVSDSTLVRDLRVQVWAEHLRVPLTGELRAALEDPDRALGMWRADWAPPGRAVSRPSASALREARESWLPGRARRR